MPGATTGARWSCRPPIATGRAAARSRSGDRRGAPLEVRVQDNGPGVPPDLRDHLFEPFVTTKSQGTGLGLTLAAKLVGDHDGAIEFDSEPGRTVFRVRLPIEPAATSTESASS